MRRRVAALVAIGASALIAATAFAAADGTISASAPTYAWDGGPGNGAGAGTAAVRCTRAVYECHDKLIEIKDSGILTVEIKAGSGVTDLDAALIKSDADGANSNPPPGDDSANVLAEDVSTKADAKFVFKKAVPGFYVLRVRVFDAAQGVWAGKATLAVPTAEATPEPTTTAPPAAVPPAQATPAPKEKANAAKKRKACQKKAKKIKNKRKRAAALKRCKKIK